jgi:hypothetical protein
VTMFLRLAVVLVCSMLVACAAHKPPTIGPTMTSQSVTLGGAAAIYNLHAIAEPQTAAGAKRVKAGKRSIYVDAQPIGTMSMGARNAVPETASAMSKCYVLVDKEARAVPVWPDGLNGDLFAFTPRPGLQLLESRDEVGRTSQAYQAALREAASLTSRFDGAKRAFAASPAYRNGSCSLSATPIARPRDAISPADAQLQAEGLVQSAVVGRLGCSAGAKLLVDMNKQPKWVGFAADWACSEATRPKDYPPSPWIDLLEMLLHTCIDNKDNGLGAKVACTLLLTTTMKVRYDTEVRDLTAQYRAPYDRWQAAVRNEQQRVDNLLASCNSARNDVVNLPSTIVTAEDRVVRLKSTQTEADARLASLMTTTFEGDALKCSAQALNAGK